MPWMRFSREFLVQIRIYLASFWTWLIKKAKINVFDNSLWLNSIIRNFESKVSDFYLILYSFLFLFVSLLVVLLVFFGLHAFDYFLLNFMRISVSCFWRVKNCQKYLKIRYCTPPSVTNSKPRMKVVSAVWTAGPWLLDNDLISNSCCY